MSTKALTENLSEDPSQISEDLTPEQRSRISATMKDRLGRQAHRFEVRISELEAKLALPADERAAKQVAELQEQNRSLSNQIRLSDAIARVGFKDQKAVRKLVQEQVVFDPSGSIRATGEDGRVYHNLNNFLSDWGDQNSYLLTGASSTDGKSGSGAVGRSQMTEREKVAFVRRFGKEKFLKLPR